MLIVNADDWGRSKTATDNAAACFRRGRITSASAMVFMDDSVRGAAVAKELGIDIGLHINLSEEFTAHSTPAGVLEAQRAVRRFLKKSRFTLLIYNPFLRRQFSEIIRAQAEEFTRLFGSAPSRLDGHQHLHLSTNILLDHLLPAQSKVRRSFSFASGEKSLLNRGYRAFVDSHLSKRHRLTDYFFALASNLEPERLRKVAGIARDHSVELMAHPEVTREFDFLMSDEFSRVISGTPLGTYQSI